MAFPLKLELENLIKIENETNGCFRPVLALLTTSVAAELQIFLVFLIYAGMCGGWRCGLHYPYQLIRLAGHRTDGQDEDSFSDRPPTTTHQPEVLDCRVVKA